MSASVSRDPAPTVPGFPLRPSSKPPNRSRPLIAAAVAASLAAGIWATDRWLVARDVPILSVAPVDLAIELTGSATLDALHLSTIGFKQQGILETVVVDRNDDVRAGDLIATLDARDLARELDAASASQTAAREAVRLAQADLARAEAVLANAKSSLDRRNALLARGHTTAEMQEEALSAHRQAIADLNRARAAIDQARAQEAAAAATMALRQVQVEQSRLTAPFDGIVVTRSRWVGDTVTPGTAVVSIADPSSIVLTTRLDESTITRLSPGQTASIRFSDAASPPVTARVLRVAREVDTETREFTVDLTPDSLPANWAIGQRAIATITVARKSGVLAVPVSALDRGAGVPTVWLNINGRAQRRVVELGDSGHSLVEVRNGLTTGDRVITEPQGLHVGMRVRAGGAMT